MRDKMKPYVVVLIDNHHTMPRATAMVHYLGGDLGVNALAYLHDITDADIVMIMDPENGYVAQTMERDDPKRSADVSVKTSSAVDESDGSSIPNALIQGDG